MKYCNNCGEPLEDSAYVCSNCGCSVPSAGRPVRKDDTLETVIKVFMIIGCVSVGWAIIPLAWCIPMTVSVFKKLNAGLPISTGLKVCSLLFVSLVAGICMLCMKDDPYARY